MSSDEDEHDAVQAAARTTKKNRASKRPRLEPAKADPLESLLSCKQSLLKSVVKLFVTKVGAKFDNPWRKGNQKASTGSGFCIAPNLIVTNAHVVVEHTVIRVRRPGCATKFPAKVLFVGHEIDLALVGVEADSFWKDMPSLHLSRELPHLDHDVTCVGYPTGGDGISVTRGVVSRICLHPYVAFGSPLLTLQIDAAINPGNSGGPVFDSNHNVVGVARALMLKQQNIGYIIAIPVLDLFLQQFRTKGPPFQGVSALSIQVQLLESLSLRRKLGIPDSVHGGVRIKDISPLGPLANVATSDDVLLDIAGKRVAEDGTVALGDGRENERLGFQHLISCRPVESEVAVTLLRNGKSITTTVCLSAPTHLIPILHHVDCTPRYLIVGGVVFVSVSYPWLKAAYGQSHSYCQVILKKLREFPLSHEDELVALSKVLSHDVNFGFQLLKRQVVDKFNGVAIKNLSHLHTMVQESKDDFFEFSLSNADSVVLSRADCVSSEEEILKQHSIPKPSLGANVLPRRLQ